MVGESNQNVFLIQKDASNFAEFEISEFEISRVDCKFKTNLHKMPDIAHMKMYDIVPTSIVLRYQECNTDC